MNHTLTYLTKKGAGTNLPNCRTVESALRQHMLCCRTLMKQDFGASLRADPNFMPKFLIELVHSRVSYAIAKAAEIHLQILLGHGQPHGQVFLNRQNGGNIPGRDLVVDGYDVLVVFVELELVNNHVVSTHCACCLYRAH